MRGGDLRSRVTLQAKVSGKDQYGQVRVAWTDRDVIWADVRYLSGLGTLKSGAETSTAKASVRVRYRPDLQAGLRLKHGNNYLMVNAVLPDYQYKDYVDLVCEAVKNES